MNTIKVINFSTLTDYCALVRAGLYLAGKTDEAQENNITVDVKTRFSCTTVIVKDK